MTKFNELSLLLGLGIMSMLIVIGFILKDIALSNKSMACSGLNDTLQAVQDCIADN